MGPNVDERALPVLPAKGETDTRGLRQGPWRLLDEREETRVEVSFTDGEPDGELVRSHPGGALLERGTFERGKRVGTFEAFYADGSPWYRYRFEEDAPVGVWELWHPGEVLSRRIDWSLPDPPLAARQDDPNDDDVDEGGDDGEREEPPRRLQRFSFDGTPGSTILPPPQDLERPSGFGLVVYVEELGGFAWMSGGEEPRLLRKVELPRLRPLTLLSVSGAVMDFDLTTAERFDLRHALGILSPSRLAGTTPDQLAHTVSVYRERVAELAEAAGEPVRLAPLVWAVSDVDHFENEVPANGLDGTVDNWGARRLRHLARGYALLGDARRAQAVEDLAGGLLGRARTLLRRLAAPDLLERPSAVLQHLDPERVFAGSSL